MVLVYCLSSVIAKLRTFCWRTRKHASIFADGSPPLLEANGVDDIDHVSIDNMNVSDMDEDVPAAPPVTARGPQARPSHQPRPPSGRQLMRSQPPPMLQRKAASETTSPSFPTPTATSPPTSGSASVTAPRGEIVDEEVTPMQRKCDRLFSYERIFGNFAGFKFYFTPINK